MSDTPSLVELQRRLEKLEAENRSLREDLIVEKHAAEMLQQSEFSYRSLFECAGVGNGEVDIATGRFVRVNHRYCELLDYRPEELMGTTTWIELTHPDDRQANLEQLGPLMRGETHFCEIEKRYVRKDGAAVWVHLYATRINDATGKPSRIVGSVIDITEQKKAEQALRDCEAELRSITSNIPDIIARFDRGLRHVFVNPAASLATGLPPEAFLGKTHAELSIPPALCQEWDSALQEVFDTGQPQMLCFASYSAGSPRRFESRAIPEPGINGRIEHVLTITRDVTAAWHSAQELNQARQAAEDANAAKDRFLAVLSHELRTPLSPVRMAISIWERNKQLLPPRFHDDLAMIRRNVDLECRLIDDMLDLNRIIQGKVDLQLAPLSMHEVIRHALKNVEGLAKTKRIVLSFDPQATNADVSGDSARLQQVLLNLLKNAMKFTPPGGSVVVRNFNRDANHFSVEVRDTGAGIEPEAINRIFNAFEQGGAEVTRRFGGLGLGLAISKALVELHGGTLSAASEGKDRGATFTLELKTAAPVENIAENRGITPANPTGLSSTQTEALLHILLVEDHKEMANVMRVVLGSCGHSVEVAGSVAEALAAAQSQSFDLIISDIGLPDGSGHELMRQLCRAHPTRGIALTGFGMEDDIKQSQDAGFTAHLTKPIDVEQLELTIQRVMALKAK